MLEDMGLFIRTKKRVLALMAILCIILTVNPIIPVLAGPEDLEITFADAFPDDIFCAHVLSILGGGRTKDSEFTDSDTDKIAAIKKLDVSDMGISSLEGIKYFTGLEDLDADYNNITSLDLSNNLSLKKLSATGNGLTTLILPKSDKLLSVNVDYNNLTRLDISHNPRLEELFICDNLLSNENGGLDVTNNKALEFLAIEENYLTSRDQVTGWRLIPALIPEVTFYYLPQKGSSSATPTPTPTPRPNVTPAPLRPTPTPTPRPNVNPTPTGKKQLTVSMVKLTGSGVYEYTGSQIIPTYTVTDGSLLRSSDYTVQYIDNVNVGTASIYVQATDRGNYWGLAIREFRIVKATPEGVPAVTSITGSGKTLADAKLTLPFGGFKNPVSKATVPGTLSWDAGNKQVVKENTAYRWIFTPTDTKSYNTVSGSLTPYQTGNSSVATPGITPVNPLNTPDIPVPTAQFGKLFRDVPEGVWYEDSVTEMYEQGLMRGTSEDPMLFSPGIPLSRAMIVTVLHRYEGDPGAADFSSPFSDIPEGQWYTNAVVWMAENGVVTGYPDGRFAPVNSITRQELAAILIRYADHKGLGLPVNREYQSFNDDAAIADYAIDAVRRCYTAGVINGREGNIFDPRGNATRAEAAAMMHRFLTLS